MNQKAKCHQIEGCHGLYIDAFRAFKAKTQDKNSAFILTHYHSDHYNGLPRSYTGPALIHCTPVTAALLREIHGIESKFIVEHNYGCSWRYTINRCNNINRIHESSKSTSSDVAEITFYDANHCPGAAIIYVHILGKDKHHVHTGDMRFNLCKFSAYPLIRQAVEQNKIDLLYLDTTYSKPKHDFIPQDEAIQMISSEVKKLLCGNNELVELKRKSFFQPKIKTGNSPAHDHRTLVLLSCYSIGKEKVLWNSAIESNQKVYVCKAKYKMLQCIRQDNAGGKCGQDVSCNIITKCTNNPGESDIHVIKMGTAGSLFPFFKPNFEQCALYAHQLNKGYSKVVAFIPTGWANSSKFNRENAIASKEIPMDDIKELLPPRTAQKGCFGNDSSIQVEVRIIPYSEHSSFSELRSCVEFFKPRQIIPTVFSNDKDYMDIESRFRDLVDSQRAKAAFIRSLSGGNAAIPNENKKRITSTFKRSHEKESTHQHSAVKKNKMSEPNIDSNQNTTVQQGGQVDDVKPEDSLNVDDTKIAILVSMGFEASRAHQCLKTKGNDLEGAIELLLQK